MTILITGGAGFIGSNLIASLNEAGIDDIIVYDTFAHSGQWRNLVGKKYTLAANEDKLYDFPPRMIKAVVHLAANTDTAAEDQASVLKDNYALPMRFLGYADNPGVPFIYASSAAVYGDGERGFGEQNLDLRPRSLYAWSKLEFDRFACCGFAADMQQRYSRAQVVGLRFFNVYGPNEYHKGRMASLLTQKFDQFRATGSVDLFAFFAAGGITRDFVYVDDVVATIRWFLDHPDVSGIYNVGTGSARSFEDVFHCAASRLHRHTFNYILMPPELAETYQFHTQADLTRLRAAGCDVNFRSIELGVPHYVDNYLAAKDRYR